MKKQRIIKVSAQRKFCKKHNEFKCIEPKIIISGKWLANAGFKFGDTITININHQNLSISV